RNNWSGAVWPATRSRITQKRMRGRFASWLLRCSRSTRRLSRAIGGRLRLRLAGRSRSFHDLLLATRRCLKGAESRGAQAGPETLTKGPRRFSLGQRSRRKRREQYSSIIRLPVGPIYIKNRADLTNEPDSRFLAGHIYLAPYEGFGELEATRQTRMLERLCSC